MGYDNRFCVFGIGEGGVVEVLELVLFDFNMYEEVLDFLYRFAGC